MRKILLMILLVMFCFTPFLQADGFGDYWYRDDDSEGFAEDRGEVYPLSEAWEFQMRVAGFYPVSERFRDIYGSFAGEAQIETAKMVNKNWGLWCNCSYYPNTGHSIGLSSFTRINFIPISFGIKWMYSITSRLDFYIGGGVAFSLLDIEDTGGTALTHIHTWDTGWLTKSGFRYDLSHRFFLDLFCDYLFQQYDFATTTCGIERLNTDAGGVTVGLGIGFKI